MTPATPSEPSEAPGDQGTRAHPFGITAVWTITDDINPFRAELRRKKSMEQGLD
jgi:hypothetical protein